MQFIHVDGCKHWAQWQLKQVYMTSLVFWDIELNYLVISNAWEKALLYETLASRAESWYVI